MSTLTTIQSTDLITNSRANINDNFAALNADKLETSVLDTDTTLAADSDSKVPTQKAVKAYVDAGGNPDIAAAQAGGGDFGTPSATNKFVTEDKVDSFSAPIVRTYLTADSPATWTKPAGLKYVVVEVQAAGGGGSGADFDDTRGLGGSGAAGGYSKKLIAAASLGATETVTVGAAGAGGTSSSSPTAGGDGDAASFGSHCSANGGTGAVAGNTQPVAGGTATGGDVNIAGGASVGTHDGASVGFSKGGDSQLGKGGTSTPMDGLQTTENTPTGYGGGGGAGQEYQSGSFTGGKAGGPGIVIVTEYYV